MPEHVKTKEVHSTLLWIILTYNKSDIYMVIVKNIADTLNNSCISLVSVLDAFEACNDKNLRAP